MAQREDNGSSAGTTPGCRPGCERGNQRFLRLASTARSATRLPVGSRFVGTPRVGFGTSQYGRACQLGYGLSVLQAGPMHFEVGVEAQRRENPMHDGTDHGVLGRATIGW